MPDRHPVQIPPDLWKLLCEDAAKHMIKRQKAVTPAQRLREIITEYFEKKTHAKKK
ncbi:MAG: hypothetical protein K9M57_10040 [Phycisphaerae bacterium]|nr:hypothetical protein [Phycisphaerae bacterium]